MQSNSNNKYAWLIVARNEGQRLVRQLEKMCQHNQGIDIIVMDGNSNDGSLELLSKGSSGITTLLVSSAALGFSTDLQLGLIFAAREGYLGVVTSDGNGKDSVEDVQKFIKQLEVGADFIQGSRFLEKDKHSNTPFLRYLGIRFISSPFTSIISGLKITDTTNGFRAYSKKLIEHDQLRLEQKSFQGYSLVSYVPFFVGRHQLNFREISVRRDYPATGATPTKIVSPLQWIQIFFDLFRGAFATYSHHENCDWIVFTEN
jgi:dolichol-phosphate mannosyltransferase